MSEKGGLFSECLCLIIHFLLNPEIVILGIDTGQCLAGINTPKMIAHSIYLRPSTTNNPAQQLTDEQRSILIDSG